jgi:hypothetical protein
VKIEGEGQSESCVILLKDPESILPGAEFIQSNPIRMLVQGPVVWVSRLTQKDLPNPLATNAGQLLELMEANYELFGFHLGIPANLMTEDAGTMRDVINTWKKGEVPTLPQGDD